MKSIDIFPWDEHFKVGIDTIDKQHYRLVELLNQTCKRSCIGSQIFQS
jgi:hemerythrin